MVTMLTMIGRTTLSRADPRGRYGKDHLCPPTAVCALHAGIAAAFATLVGVAVFADSVFAEPLQVSGKCMQAAAEASYILEPPRASLAGVPRRIITIAPNSAEIICALGAGDRIVGVSKFCVFPPELKDRPRVGGLFDPDLERITTLKPDLVVLRGRSESLEQLCSQLGVAVYLDQTNRLADIEACVVELGGRLGRASEAAVLVERFRGRLDAIRKRVAGKPRPRVLLTAQRLPDRIANVLTAGKGTFLTEMLEIAGGKNIFGHLDIPWPQTSLEAILAQRPAVIIELMPELELTDELRQRLLGQWKHLGPIPAVAQGRIYFITDDHALIPSPRYVEIIERVSRILHPEGADGR